MIAIEDLYLEFPPAFSLSINKLTIEKGKIFTIIGPNAAGKSTFLNILGLFQRPKRGKIKILGEDILSLKNPLPFRRRFSFVFSQPYLFSGSVYENVSLPLRLRGIPNDKKIDAMLELFQIREIKRQKIDTLSSGQMHRVCLARSLVTEPELILLDEPFLSLDPHFKEPLINQLRHLLRQNQTTAIFVTQDQFEALSLADELAVMKDGRILQCGQPQDIFSSPTSKEVADFVGIETILEGIIVKKEDSLCYVQAKDKILKVVSDYNIGEQVFICIRPENVTLINKESVSSARNHFKGRIENIYNTGLYFKIEVDCGFRIISSVTQQSVDDLELKPDREIFVSFKATAVHLIKR